MTDAQAKWIALERVRAAIIIDFSSDVIQEIMPKDEMSPLMVGDTFWFCGIQFQVVDKKADLANFEFFVSTRRIGGRPFTLEEATCGHFRLSAHVA